MLTKKLKFCRGCQTPKPVKEFYFLNKKKGWRRSKCITCINKQNAKWSQENTDHHRELRREHSKFTYRVQLDSSRAESRDRVRRQNLELKVECFEKLGGCCVRCGYDIDQRALQIDHVHGGGTQERRRLKSTAALYRKVLADTEGNYQLLCANCNQIKKHEQQEWGRVGVRKLGSIAVEC
jgi:hypothetical protein